jgi:hypothetical protein
MSSSAASFAGLKTETRTDNNSALQRREETGQPTFFQAAARAVAFFRPPGRKFTGSAFAIVFDISGEKKVREKGLRKKQTNHFRCGRHHKKNRWSFGRAVVVYRSRYEQG